MFQELPAHTDIIGVIWFEAFNVIDWKVTDDLAASRAFAAGLASPQYQVQWKPGMPGLLTVPVPALVPGTAPAVTASPAAPAPATTPPPVAATTPVTRPSSPAPPRPVPTTSHPATPAPKPSPTLSPATSLP
jgi:hypothetical protein